MKKKSKGISILLIYLLASFVGVSFAWMSARTVPTTDEAFFNWGDDDDYTDPDDPTNHSRGHTLTVQERALDFKAYYYDKSINNYLYLGADSSFTYEKLVPSDYATIRLDFTNTTEEIADIKLQIGEIEVDQDLKQYIYFGINETSGYSSGYYYTDPIGTYVWLTDAIDYATLDEETNRVKCNLTLIDDLELTPTGETGVISIYMYIMMNRNAPNEMQGKTLSFGTIRAIFA